ncbi:hypothetical protein KI387_003343, partial [Taxus chinensis]
TCQRPLVHHSACRQEFISALWRTFRRVDMNLSAPWRTLHRVSMNLSAPFGTPISLSTPHYQRLWKWAHISACRQELISALWRTLSACRHELISALWRTYQPVDTALSAPLVGAHISMSGTYQRLGAPYQHVDMNLSAPFGAPFSVSA